MKTEYEARNFEEGSLRPEEEHPYWYLLRGERVPLGELGPEGSLYRLAVAGMIHAGEVVEDIHYSAGLRKGVVYIPTLHARYEEQLPSRVGLTPSKLSLPYSEAAAILRNHGELETFITPSNKKVTVLPTCSVPIARFIEGQFDASYRHGLGVGNFRRVYFVEREDGSSTGLVAKSPERVFNGSLDKWYTGDFWYGGKRSGHRPIYIEGNPLVEEQAVWEAVFLLTLARIGIKAELPQALVEHEDGSRELIVREIIEGRVKTSDDTLTDVAKKRRIESAGLIPNDSGSHNHLLDTDGYWNIIDVNRWSMPSQSNSFKQRLADLIRSAVEAADKNKVKI